MSLLSTPSEKAEILETASVRGRSLWDDALARLLRNRAAVTSMIIRGILILLATLGQALWVHDYDTIYRDKVWIAPTWEDWHLLGTDAQGRDMVARILVGLGVSLMVGVVATFVSLLIVLAFGGVVVVTMLVGKVGKRWMM